MTLLMQKGRGMPYLKAGRGRGCTAEKYNPGIHCCYMTQLCLIKNQSFSSERKSEQTSEQLNFNEMSSNMICILKA